MEAKMYNSIAIRCPYALDGPYIFPHNLLARSGVFMVLVAADGATRVLDIGESLNVKVAAMNSERANRWTEHREANVYYCATYIDASEPARLAIEKHIRSLNGVP